MEVPIPPKLTHNEEGIKEVKKRRLLPEGTSSRFQLEPRFSQYHSERLFGNHSVKFLLKPRRDEEH